MENKTKEIFNIEYEIITPTHIGSGDNIPKTELGFFPEENLIRKVDIDKFFESQPPHKIRELSQFIRQAKNDYFNNILRTEKFSIDNLEGEYDLNFYYDYRPTDINKIRDISAYLKTPLFKPYIPGSSIKGWLRTAILYYYLKRIKEAKAPLEAFNRRLDNLPREKWKIKKERGKMGEIAEKEIFGKDPREDLFKFITITDTQAISPENLCLALVQIFHPAERRGQINFEALGFSVFAEILKDKSNFLGKIIFSKDIGDFKNEYLHSDSFSDRIRNYIIENLIELPREECFKKVCEISNIFSKHIIEYNHRYLTKLNDEIKSNSIQDLIKYYNETLFPLYDHVSESDNMFLMRLGYGTEWTSKTIGLELIDYFIKNKKVDFNTFYDRINRLKLFKGQRMHKHFQLTPISRAYIVNNINAPQMPLGWVKAQIKS